jgi:hypothetical protein
MHLLPGDVFSPDSPTDPPSPHDQESKGLDELTPTDHNDQEQEGLLQATTHNSTAPAIYAPENMCPFSEVWLKELTKKKVDNIFHTLITKVQQKCVKRYFIPL